MERLALDPKVRAVAAVAAWGGSGFLISAVRLGNFPQPVAVGMICSAAGWKALLMALGAVLGYPAFWGAAGNSGIVWSAAGGVLAILVGRRQERQEQPLMVPAIGAFLTALTGLGFRLILKETVPIGVLGVQTAIAYFSGVLFTQAARCRDPVTDWLVWGVGVLALSRVFLGPYLSLGCVAAGLMGVGAPFPAAALAGIALDLSKITEVPMTAVLCLAYFLRMIPFDRKWKPLTAPAVAYVLVATVCGSWDIQPLPGLAAGSVLGIFLPPRPQIAHRRGETGVAQVRLELGAQVLDVTQELLMEMKTPPIDREALMEKVRRRACAGCSARRECSQWKQLSAAFLENPLEADCRKQSRLIPELQRAQEQLRFLQGDRKRRQEYRMALLQQYRFLSGYLRTLADRLPRRGEYPKVAFRIEVAARSRGKEQANGDRCYAFAGTECRYFVLLCDGMGTGLGAAREAHGTGSLLRQMLASGFPPEHAMETVNSLMALRGSAGAVTVDLAEIALDTGIARIYKWGAAPGWIVNRRGLEKIGTATPPPGIGVEDVSMAVEKLSLRRGEVLIMVSDGVDGEEFRHRSDLSPDAPLGEMVAKILDSGGGMGEDDATAALLRLRPAGMPPS